ncbi:hypothetical protein Tco_0405974 [Tanacetum coccineum]
MNRGAGGAGAGGVGAGGAGADGAGAGGAGAGGAGAGGAGAGGVANSGSGIVEQYIRGLSKNIRGDVTLSQPATIDHAVRMAYQLMGQIIQDKNDKDHEGEKRKGEGDRGGWFAK